MIKLKDNGDIDIEQLTKEELSTLADIRLDYHKRRLDEVTGNSSSR